MVSSRSDLDGGSHARWCNLGAVQGASWPETGKGDAIDGLYCQDPPEGAPQMQGGVCSLASAVPGSHVKVAGTNTSRHKP